MPPFKPVPGGVHLTVRLTPKASADRILGSGEEGLKVAVTAPPEDGKANEALLRLLARQFRLPRRDFEIVLGAKDRRKVVSVAGDPAVLAPLIAKTLAPWLNPA